MNFIILLPIFLHLLLIFMCTLSMGLLVDKKKTFIVNLFATIDVIAILMNFYCIVDLIENQLFK